IGITTGAWTWSKSTWAARSAGRFATTTSMQARGEKGLPVRQALDDRTRSEGAGLPGRRRILRSGGAADLPRNPQAAYYGPKTVNQRPARTQKRVSVREATRPVAAAGRFASSAGNWPHGAGRGGRRQRTRAARAGTGATLFLQLSVHGCDAATRSVKSSTVRVTRAFCRSNVRTWS